jgi:hypothetical protein
MPILAMYGDNSQARLSGDRLRDVWPHAEFRRVRDAGHFFPITRADELIAACERFWGAGFADCAERYRADETRRNYFRSDRVFSVDDGWYFATRENDRVGPFAGYESALEALDRQLAAVHA